METNTAMLLELLYQNIYLIQSIYFVLISVMLAQIVIPKIRQKFNMLWKVFGLEPVSGFTKFLFLYPDS